jgi:N-acetylmuramoyl-L-alanine amidase
MAKFFTLVAGISLVALMSFAGGCQSEADISAQATLPPPNFNTPTIQQQPPVVYQPIQPAPRPAPAPVAVRPVTPAPHRTFASASRVPADWLIHVPARHWQWIIIHHTATSFGNAAIVTRWHIDRGFDEMGYHFLIGNGTNSGDGQVEVGTRWPKQKWGAHTKTPDNRFNDFGIGICLVGNFDVQYPSAAQMRSLDRLVAYLMKTYHIPPDHILGHNNCKSTDCPGKHLSVAVVRHSAVKILADEGVNIAEPQMAASDELIHDVP